MLAAMAASVILVTAAILIFYETLRLTSRYLTQLPIPARTRIIPLVLACFAAHTAAVWTYAGGLLAVRGALAGAQLRWRAGRRTGRPRLFFGGDLHVAGLRRPCPGRTRAAHCRCRGAERFDADRLVGVIHLPGHGTVLAMHVRRLRSADFTRPLGPDATSDWKVVEAGDQPRIRAAPGPRVR